MRNITDEQIEKAFENEAETRQRNSAYATALEKYVALMAVSLSQAGGRDGNILTKRGITMIEITNEKMEKLYKMQTTLVKSYTTISAIVILWCW